jgi:hypothetical protein
MFVNRTRFQRPAAIVLLIAGTALMGSEMASAKSRRSRGKVAQARFGIEIPRPDIGPGMAAPDRWAFTAAFRSAIQRIHEHGSCSDLFLELDLTGPEALSGTHYELARTPERIALCQGGVSAVTSIRGNKTSLCYHFKVLSQNDKAATLIHEALHTAGLSEWPVDPGGSTPREITAMVKSACSL